MQITGSELRLKCKRKSDYIITLFITNEVSLFFTWILIRTRITPNQITMTSVFFGLLCGLCYSRGWFLTGSLFLFLSHVMDCTDSNLARAKEMFSTFGRWLDYVGDRLTEVFVFLGVSFYFINSEDTYYWPIVSILAGLFLLLYYYIVDISMLLGISNPVQELTSIRYKDVNVKWGLLEPVLYGFIILSPFGFLKAQIILIFIISIVGIIYQAYKNCLQFKSS